MGIYLLKPFSFSEDQQRGGPQDQPQDGPRGSPQGEPRQNPRFLDKLSEVGATLPSKIRPTGCTNPGKISPIVAHI